MKRREALAIVLGSLSLPGCMPAGKATPPPRRKGRRPIVVFVHGLFQNGDVSFGKLRRRLESRGIECFAPSLTPADAHDGLDRLAEQLKERIDARFGEDERFSVVGFSMGGLIARYYLQELGGAARCDRLFTVSTPHHGTWSSWGYPGKGARQMQPGSEFLKRLEASEGRLGTMQVVSYRSTFDPVILPPDSPVWKRAENHEFSGYVHLWITRNEPLIEDLEARLIR
jgi:triacylglycerol lipase